jgi:sugar phosphate isomerase/epimerase
MPARFPVAAITDEFSPDLDRAARSMSAIGIAGAEFRMLSGKNIVDLTDKEVDQAVALARSYGLEVVSIASPLLKCVLPDAPAVDARFQQDVFAARHTFADQPRLAARTFEIAAIAGARIIRVFTYWRTVRPAECFSRIVDALGGLAEQAAAQGVTIGIENEHACNIATGEETARVLAALRHPALKVVWDPANALVSGENPFPEGYAKIPAGRIVHVHAKDCRVHDHKAEWMELGKGSVDWPGQIAALERDGYRGWISLETHWPGPGGDKHQASIICGRNLVKLVKS